ncbi:MAG: HD domain-containing protein [Armatimonadetes bacterium]|nr:HD domain-containing protein [Armatimonadota bacterium]
MAAETHTCRQEPTDVLRIGDALSRPVYGRPDGASARVLLLAAGQRIESELQLRRLREAGFAVQLPSEERSPNDPALPPADPSPPAASAMFTQRLEAGQRLRQTVIEAAGDITRRVASGAAPDIPNLLSASSVLAAEVAADPYAVATVAHLQQCDDYTVEHSADVAILTVAIAHLLGRGATDLRLLALAGLLHDVGKQRVPKEILDKPGPLTPEELKEVRRHPQHGFDILTHCEDCAPEARLVALQHHECPDGSGYPAGCARSVLHPYSLIAAVADTFDAMTADRVYHKGIPARPALLQLHAARETHFDAAAVAALIKLVGVYPVGTRVVLNTGERAVVIAPNPEDTTRPVVQVDQDHLGRALARSFTLFLQGASCCIVAAQ